MPSFSDDGFGHELGQSYPYVVAVAKAFDEAGVQTITSPPVFRLHLSEIPDFTRHEQDIILVRSKVCIEVKSRNEEWSETIPFRFDTIFVDTVSGFQGKAISPIAYVHVSRVTGFMSVTPVFKKVGWVTQSALDPKRGHSDLFYAAPKSEMRNFSWLVDVCRRLESLPSNQDRAWYLDEIGLRSEGVFPEAVLPVC